jgi:hypothetical protein
VLVGKANHRQSGALTDLFGHFGELLLGETERFVEDTSRYRVHGVAAKIDFAARYLPARGIMPKVVDIP